MTTTYSDPPVVWLKLVSKCQFNKLWWFFLVNCTVLTNSIVGTCVIIMVKTAIKYKCYFGPAFNWLWRQLSMLQVIFESSWDYDFGRLNWCQNGYNMWSFDGLASKLFCSFSRWLTWLDVYLVNTPDISAYFPASVLWMYAIQLWGF